jgi:hypothetical protein
MNPAVGPSKIFAPRRAENISGLARFGQSDRRRAIAAELAGREIAQADRVSRCCVLGDRAAEADFEVVRMGSKDQEIHGHGN